MVFDTNLKIDMLENVHENKKDTSLYFNLLNDLNMWLSLLCTETVEDAIKLIQFFPSLKEVFIDMQEYTTNPSEAINTFSEALRILDINTVNYMVNDMKAEIEAQKIEVATKDNIIKELQNTIITLNSTINEQNNTNAFLKSTIDSLNITLSDMKDELSQLKKSN